MLALEICLSTFGLSWVKGESVKERSQAYLCVCVLWECMLKRAILISYLSIRQFHNLWTGSGLHLELRWVFSDPNASGRSRCITASTRCLSYTRDHLCKDWDNLLFFHGWVHHDEYYWMNELTHVARSEKKRMKQWSLKCLLCSFSQHVPEQSCVRGHLHWTRFCVTFY